MSGDQDGVGVVYYKKLVFSLGAEDMGERLLEPYGLDLLEKFLTPDGCFLHFVPLFTADLFAHANLKCNKKNQKVNIFRPLPRSPPLAEKYAPGFAAVFKRLLIGLYKPETTLFYTFYDQSH